MAKSVYLAFTHRVASGLIAVTAALTLTLPATQTLAQGKPDLVWMRSPGTFGKGLGSLVQASRTISPDGTLLATSDGYTTKLWRLSDGMVLNTLSFDGGWVTFSKDGNSVIGAFGKVFRVFRVSDGQKTLEVTGLSGNATSIALSPNGATVAVGLDDGTIELRAATTGVKTGSYAVTSGGVLSVAYSPNGLRLAVGSTSTVYVWNTATKALMYAAQPAGPTGYTVAISPDSTYLYTQRSSSGSVGIGSYNLDTGTAVSGFWFGQPVSDIAVASDGKVAVSYSNGVSGGNNTTIFNNGLFASAMNLSMPFGGTPALIFSPDASTIATISAGSDLPGSGISLWRCSDGLQLKQLTPNIAIDDIAGLAVSPDGSLVASASAIHGGVVLRNRVDGSIVRSLSVNESHQVALSPDGKLFASNDYNSVSGSHLKSWRVSDGSLVLDIPNLQGGNLAFTPDSTKIVASNSTGICVFKVSNGSLVRQFPQAGIFALTPDGTQIAIYDGANDHTIFIYSMENGSLVRSFNAQYNGLYVSSVAGIAISPDGTQLALGGPISFSNTGGAELLSMADGSLVSFVPTNDGPTSAVAFSPDGLVLVTGSTGGTLSLWSVPTGVPIVNYQQEIGSVGAVTYSLDGKYIYYGRARNDGTLCCALNPYRDTLVANHGGNTGSVTVKVITSPDFPVTVNTTVTLRSTGQPDIVGLASSADNGFVLNVTFDLTGAPLGKRDVVITNLGGGARTYPQGFTVEQGVAPQFTTQVVGRALLRGGVFAPYYAVVENLGNNDAAASDVRFEFPNYFLWQGNGENPFTGEHSTSVSVPISTVPGGSELTIPIQLQVPDLLQYGDNTPFTVAAWTDQGPIARVKYIGSPNSSGEQTVLAADITDTASGEVYATSVFGSVDPSSGTLTVDSATFDGIARHFVETFDTFPRPVLINYNGPGGVSGYMQFSYPNGITITQIDIFDTSSGNTIFVGEYKLDTDWDSESFGVLKFTDPFDLHSIIIEEVRALGLLHAGWELLESPASWPVIVLWEFAEDEGLDWLNGHWPFIMRLFCHSVTSHDPNALAGISGFGAPQWVSASRPLTYSTYFSNVPTATAAAQVVTVTEHLDATELDTTTVSIGAITINGITVLPTADLSLPVGMRQFSASLDMRPANNLLVNIDASLNMLTGNLTWTFVSIDPDTGLPLDRADPRGFLQPGEEASVLLNVTPKSGLTTGTVVNNSATIVFDANPPMNTNVWSNTIDNTPPVSKVNELGPVQEATQFNVSWLASDVGSGVLYATIYVSDNNGPYMPLLANTTLTSSTFTGQPGHKYAFYSDARDNTYNIEPAHARPDTVTTVTTTPYFPSAITFKPALVQGGAETLATLTLTGPAPHGGLAVSLAASGPASVPASMTVPEGSTSAILTVKTIPVSASIAATITAKALNSTVGAKFTVLAPISRYVTFVPSYLQGGHPTTGTVHLSGPAPSGGYTVQLMGSGPVGVPASLTIPAGLNEQTFPVTTPIVAVDTLATVTASANGSTVSGTLHVLAPFVEDVTFSPTSVHGGAPSNGRVTISGPAPPGGLTVKLVCKGPASAPNSVLVPEGRAIVVFTVNTSAVTANAQATVTATLNASSAAGTLTVTPP